MPNMNDIVGTHHILWITLDTLRYDVAQRAFDEKQIPEISKYLPSSGWERRHTPANFTYAAHHAFFAGFLPTVTTSSERDFAPGTRLFASEFAGSQSIGPDTCVFEEPNVVAGLANRGYATHCIGGVGFFNKQNALGSVLPELFQRSYWSDELSVTCPESTENQVALARRLIEDNPTDKRQFLFVNVSALHQPNCIYASGESKDSPDTQLAALSYVDRAITPLFDLIQSVPPWFVMICSDHGTAYGEDGRVGHRWNHPVIGDVPYADFIIDGK